MGINHSIGSDPTATTDSVRSRKFIAQSKSFNSAGDVNSSFEVPAGRVWEIQTLRALNAEAAAREVAFQVVDPDGLQYALLSKTGTRVAVDAGELLGWDGSVFIPPGWTIRAYFWGMVGGVSSNWQYTGFEYPSVLFWPED